jgi:RNA polymerase sigma-70 factor (ECF subfamily)
MPVAAVSGATLVESDETLVRRARRGEREAFSRLVERYERPALAVAAAVLGSHEEARDAVQDAFVTAFEKLNWLWSPRKFGAWFLQIARRQAFARRRSARARRELVPLSADVAWEAPRDALMSADIPAVIARLPEQEYVVVTLRHIEELSVADIAAVTGRPIGTVTKQLSRAYARMRPWLEELR